MSDQSKGVPSGSTNGRRTILKAGVATGVGLAAWSGPGVGILGTSPAYAAMCSGEVQCAQTDPRATNQTANCGGSTDITQAVNALPWITAPFAQVCADGTTTITINSPFAGTSSCKAILLYGPPNNLNQQVSGVGSAGATNIITITVPNLPKSSLAANTQIAFKVCCTDDDDIALCNV